MIDKNIFQVKCIVCVCVCVCVHKVWDEDYAKPQSVRCFLSVLENQQR